MIKTLQKQALLSLFVLLSVLHLYAEQCETEWFILLTKPILVSLLALWFWRETLAEVSGFRKFIFWGLIFSVGGDTLLMFVEHGPKLEMFFLFGLGSFLIAQLCYAYALLKFPNVKEGLVMQRKWLILPFLSYLLWLLSSLWEGIPGPMRLPVAVYATAVVGMAIAAANLRDRVSESVFWGFFSGVMLFVLSDSIIALNKFGGGLPYARFSIMSTYLLGQFLIAWNACRALKEARGTAN